ncbi:MAG TPA: 50S ribosomal protein L21 [Candidatus Dormibacteraeota bacterium]|nr:50S ribosomal protein L21 [Candidatus Dormibacteraeota bacterium]
MSKPDGSLSAVIVSGGKQYRVAPGDQILVDRLDAEPGVSLKLDRVLLFSSAGDVKVGAPVVDGVDVEVKVLAHRRGPRVESLRYKSKKRVRVHHGGRADLTALQIIAVGGLTGKEAEAEDEKEGGKQARPKSRGKARVGRKAEAAEAPKAEADLEPAAEPDEPAAKPARRSRKKESE